jgi:proline iminopeptidase
MTLGRTLTVAAAAAGFYATVIRPRMLRSGATLEEVESPYPGAQIVPDSKRGSTMAVTIEAPPERVWPWLVQMGHDRGGWYSWDRLDNFGKRSADDIHDEWQDIAVGDRMTSAPNGKYWFEVAEVQPLRFLALRAVFDLRGRQIPSGGIRPPAYSDSLWCFLLKELPEGRTRLIVSVYGAARPRLPNALAAYLFWEPAHWVMQKRQFANLRRRCERQLLEEAAGPLARARG